MADECPFDDIAGDRPALLVWRVERLRLRRLPDAEHGRFHRGDAYLVYSAAPQPQHGRPPSAVLVLHVHYWIGSEASVDEAALAALMATQLDQQLGGRAVQHRERERYESPRFCSYFRRELRYLEGGIGSGLRHVDATFVARLYVVKGRRRPVVRQQPAVAWAYVNDGDAFVVDTEQFVFVWCGRTANGHEKLQAAKLAQALRSERVATRPVVVVVSGEEDRLPADECAAFDAALPLAERAVRAADDESDGELERRLAEQVELLVCAHDGNDVTARLVKTGALCQDDLVSDDVFIVDPGDVVWLWVGRRAAREQRADGMHHAEAYLAQCSRPAGAPVCRVVDGAEPVEFRSLFADWTCADEQQGLGQPAAGRVARAVAAKFDASMLHHNAGLAVQTQLVDDGSGRRRVWRVEKGDLAPLADRQHGTFFSGDCYVVHYTYSTSGRDRHIIYFWLGAKSSQDERGTAALKTVELDDGLGGRAVQVRVFQGKEPPHFMTVFGCRIVIHDGGKAAAFDRPDAQDRGVGETYLLHVRCTSRLATRAVEVPACAASLNSNDAFVLRTPSQVVVWCGRGAVDEEREAARAIACQASATVGVEPEGGESDEFWAAIGGRQPYASTRRLAERQLQPARLFHCSNASGRFRADEVCEFDQSDLCEDDVMLLDAWEAVWVWVGVRARPDERRQAEAAALQYLRTDPAGRGDATPVYRVPQGSEPPIFTGYFGSWQPDLWTHQPCWSAVKQQLAAAAARQPVEQVTDAGQACRGESVTVPLEALQARRPPDGVDPTRREDYLSPEDFKAALGMTRDEFRCLQAWKQQQKKQQAGLF